jgi:hypothetical protein
MHWSWTKMCLCIASSFTSAFLYRQIVLSMNSHMFLHCCGRTNGRHWYTQLASLHTSAEGSQYLKNCLRGWHGHIHSGQSKKESSRCTWTSKAQKSLTWHVCSCPVLWSTLKDWISFLGLAVPTSTYWLQRTPIILIVCLVNVLPLPLPVDKWRPFAA